MFETTTHLPLISRVHELLDLLYSEETAAQDEDIYQFRIDVLAQLNRAKLDPQANQSILISFIKRLQSIVNDQDEVDINTTLVLHNHANASFSSNIASNNRMAKGAKIKSEVTYNYYLSTPIQAPSYSPHDRILDLGSTPSLLPDFIGRTKKIGAIKAAMRTSIKKLEKDATKKLKNPSTRTENVNIFVISGTNGVGKTSLARELFEDLHLQYSLAAWIDASPERIYNDFCTLGEKLHVVLEGKSPARRIADIHKELAKHSPVLLVFDGVEDKDAIHQYFPQNFLFESSKSKYCHCLVTSIKSDNSNKNSFDLDVFDKEEAKKYINERLKKIRSKLGVETKYGIEKREEDDINELIEKLAAFPLALAQAMAYIEKKGGCSIKLYLQALENSKADTLSDCLPNAENYKKSVMTTWEITMRLVNQQNDLAEKVLEICAYLYSRKISKEYLRNILEKHEILEKYNKNKSDHLDEALHLLFQYSLLKKLDSNQNENLTSSYRFRVHSLLQDVIRVKIVYKDNSWSLRNVLDFRNANQRHLLRSIDNAIKEILNKSQTKQEKLEIASHWEVIMVHINKLKSYYVFFSFTSTSDFFDIKKYGELWFLPVVVVIAPMLLFMAYIGLGLIDFRLASLMYCSLLFSVLFGIKIAIFLSEQSALQKFFAEYVYNGIMLNLDTFIFLLMIPYTMIDSFYDYFMLQGATGCIAYMGFPIFACMLDFDFIKEKNLAIECKKAFDFAYLFFDDAQFNKAEEILKLGLNLLKSYAKNSTILEAQFEEILKEIQKLKDTEVNTNCQEEVCDHHQESFKILENPKITYLSNSTNKIKQKIKKVQPQPEKVIQDGSEQNRQSQKNTYLLYGKNIREASFYLETTEIKSNLAFFPHKQSENTDDLQRSTSDVSNNLQESYQEINKLKIN